MKKKRVNFSLSGEGHELLCSLATTLGLSRSSTIEYLVREYLRPQSEPKAPANTQVVAQPIYTKDPQTSSTINVENLLL